MTRGMSIVPNMLADSRPKTIRGTRVLVRHVPVVTLAALSVLMRKTAWTRLAICDVVALYVTTSEPCFIAASTCWGFLPDGTGVRG